MGSIPSRRSLIPYAWSLYTSGAAMNDRAHAQGGGVRWHGCMCLGTGRTRQVVAER